MQEAVQYDDHDDSDDMLPVGTVTYRDKRFPEKEEVLEIFVKEILKIGRDPSANDFIIEPEDDHCVSRNHCEIYVVKYDSGVHHIYARDRRSFNGTYVNEVEIGCAPRLTSGYLLQDGDVISLKPYWTFTVSQPDGPPKQELSILQLRESELFQDKYCLTQRCLGQGAEATVYLAIEQSTKKQVVCKLVNLDKIQGKNARQQYRRTHQEVDILRQLAHPNILPYVDAISSPHTLYTFMELAAGGDLMSFIYRYDDVLEFDAQIIVRQVCRGLAYLHKKGVVHRDLKPENILLQYSPKIAYHRVMLSDFGTSAVPLRNRMTTNVGTMRYQAPEFLCRDQPQGSPADIWSLGIVTLLLLSPDCREDYAVLKEMDQEAIQTSLTKDFFMTPDRPSKAGKSFVWDCLQVQPVERLTAAEAMNHTWLNATPRHCEFFEKFDQRIDSEWHVSPKLRPMPWTLPDILKPIGQDVETSAANKDNHSPYFGVSATSSIKPVDEIIPSTAQDMASTRISDQTDHKKQFVFQKPALPIHTPKISPKRPLQYGEKSRRRIQSRIKRLSEMNQMNQMKQMRKVKQVKPDVKFCDSMSLPLNTLNRHLQPLPDKANRQRVLEKLEKTKVKFLEE